MKIAVIGGHLSPALAVLDVIPSSWEVVFFGRKYTFEGDNTVSLEYRVITKRGISFVNVVAARLQRRLARHMIPSFYKLPKGYIMALSALKKHKPHVVVSFGGYLSLPVCFAAKTLGIPVVIHEQTLEAGLANKIVAKFADKICISWESSSSFFPQEKTILTGNPIKNFSMTNDQRPMTNALALPLLYVTGGSAGSHALNLLVEGMLPHILEKFRLYHQTGDAHTFNDFERLSTMRETLPEDLKKQYVLTKFVDPKDVGELMQHSSLILCRSGINTVTELLYFGKPSVVIPLPYGQKNEQQKNAEFLEKLGMAVICKQEETTSTDLSHVLATIMEDYDTYKEAAMNGRKFVHVDAAARIVETLNHVASEKTTQKGKANAR